MIYSLEGVLKAVEPNFAVLDVHGIGFGVKTTMTTIARLPQVGETAFLYTYMNVREDLMELYGFSDSEELSCFKMLITVNGVGPKAALSILSNLTPDQFALAVVGGDAKLLTRSPGIGIKTAQRIVLELKDKITKEQMASGVAEKGSGISSGVPVGNASEAISALVVLGYNQSEAAAAVTALSQELSVEEMIKAGLKALSSRR